MRRTPALTTECRRLVEEMLVVEPNGLWTFTKRIAETTGLTRQQVREAIWSEAADAWRQGVYSRAYARDKEKHPW